MAERICGTDTAKPSDCLAENVDGDDHPGEVQAGIPNAGKTTG